MNLIPTIPLAAKIKFGLKGIGITSDELKVIDGLVVNLFNNDLVNLFLPEEVKGLTHAIDIVWDKLNNAEAPLTVHPIVRNTLANPKGRAAVAALVDRQITLLSATEQEAVNSALSKLSDLPIFGKTEFSTVQDFISEGPLKLVSDYIQSSTSDMGSLVDISMLMKCPYCEEHFIPQRHR